MSHSTFLFDVISIALCHMIFAAKTLSWIQKRTRIPETPYPRGETLAASSLCWRKHRVSLRNKDRESLMVLLCSYSALRAHTCWIISPTSAREQTQSLLDQVLWGSCYRFACSPGQGDPSLSRGLVAKWEHRHRATVGFFSGFLRCLAGAKCLADADSGPFLDKQDVETIWIMSQDV